MATASASVSLSSVVSQKISSFRNRFVINHQQSQNNSSSFVCEECPICWGAMPSNPQVLPCGHVFCRKCIKDLVQYQEDHHNNDKACCPMCRGPLEIASAKRLWKEANYHEIAGHDYYRMQQVEVRISSANRLMMESQKEYRLAVQKLEECLEALKLKEQRANRTNSSQHHSRRRRRDAKHHQQQIKVLVKLIEVVPWARYHDSDDRTIQLLRTVLTQSKIPMPQMHLKLAKLLHRQMDNDLLDQVILQYQSILQIASCGSHRSSRRHAKKLQGQAHYGIARCYHQLGHYKRACREYKLCERFHALQDYGLAAESHHQLGNTEQAMEYALRQLRKESTRPTIETLLLLAKICKLYFVSLNYRGIDALEYQSRCDTYRRCVRKAQVLARHELHHRECSKHVAFLHHFFYDPSHYKHRRTIPTMYIVDDKDHDNDIDQHDDDNNDNSYDDDDDDLETEECDTEISVEL